LNFFPSPSLPLLASTLALKRNFFSKPDHFRNPPPACAPYEWAACLLFFFLAHGRHGTNHITLMSPLLVLLSVWAQSSKTNDGLSCARQIPIFRHPLPPPARRTEHIIQLTTYNIYTTYNLRSVINLKTYVQLSAFAISLSLLGIHHVIFTPIIAKVLHGTFIA